VEGATPDCADQPIPFSHDAVRVIQRGAAGIALINIPVQQLLHHPLAFNEMW
jgi:hypothetical protein